LLIAVTVALRALRRIRRLPSRPLWIGDAHRRRRARRRRYAASVTIVGQVAPGTAFDPDNIAELFWTAHSDGPDE
jgi:hypothetical protein